LILGTSLSGRAWSTIRVMQNRWSYDMTASRRLATDDHSLLEEHYSAADSRISPRKDQEDRKEKAY
jgi:hypothetical protein